MAHSDHGDHDPGHGGQQAVGRAALLTGAFMLVEVAGGLYSGSLALLADAGHMLTDTAALSLAWLAFVVARRRADGRRSFGYARFEVLAGMFNALVLLGVVVMIGLEALERLAAPRDVLPGPMLAVATLGLVVNLVAFRLLHADAEHVNVRGALLHVLGDLLGSVAAILAAVVILSTGWLFVDPLLSLLVAALILGSALRLLRETGHILLQGTPAEIDTDAVKAELLEAVPGIRDVHHVHIWSLTSGRHVTTLHLRLHEGASPASVLCGAKTRLAEVFGLDHSTIQVCGDVCPDEQRPGMPAPSH
ncbi:MAG: cation diffusion facilitator family transporter [Pseudomonadales bacterium]|jgi:cobalt-zinc-cadmium efflux system protein|nr:cation diffusion facilitator family transporter [Pseudomonadales bacterium]